MNDFFIILHDFSGRTRLESEDPRWIHIFDSVSHSIQKIPIGESPEFLSICAKLVANNKSTQNLQMLIEQTSSRLGQMLSLRCAPSSATCMHCYGALRLTAAVVNYLLSHLSYSEVLLIFKIFNLFCLESRLVFNEYTI